MVSVGICWQSVQICLKMKTVGEILQKRRQELNLQIKDVAREIKAKDYQVQAIENNNFSIFGHEVFALGYVQNYAEVLGLKPEEVVPFFKRAKERGDKAHKFAVKSQYFINEKIESAEKNVAKIITSVGILIILSLFIFFLVSEYRKNMIRPFIEVITPKENVQTSAASIQFRGKSDKENTVFINDEEIVLSEKGDFSKMIRLEKGINKFVIKAVNKSQKETIIERIVLKK